MTQHDRSDMKKNRAYHDQMGGVWQRLGVSFTVTLTTGETVTSENGNIWNGNGIVRANSKGQLGKRITYDDLQKIEINGEVVYQRT